MSTQIYKVEYVCDCGCDYGSCYAKCAVILRDHGTVDVYTLFHTDGHGGISQTSQGGLDCFSPAYFKALRKVLECKEQNNSALTEDEKLVVFNY